MKSQPKLFQYEGCSTCRRARKWLDEHKVPYDVVPIVEETPTASELERLVEASGLPIEKWFNTSGQSYRALLARIGKEGFAKLNRKEKLKLLAADGKLIKRPVLVMGQQVLVGFDAEIYRSAAK